MVSIFRHTVSTWFSLYFQRQSSQMTLPTLLEDFGVSFNELISLTFGQTFPSFLPFAR